MLELYTKLNCVEWISYIGNNFHMHTPQAGQTTSCGGLFQVAHILRTGGLWLYLFNILDTGTHMLQAVSKAFTFYWGDLLGI